MYAYTHLTHTCIYFFPLFLYWPDGSMFSTSLAVMHFHFIFTLTLLPHIDNFVFPLSWRSSNWPSIKVVMCLAQ